jgi:MIP family channel proteins
MFRFEERSPLLASELRGRGKELWTHKLWRAMLAEFLGTLLFVHIVCGVILATHNNTIMVSAAAALTIVALNYTFVEISGSLYFNPAIALAAVLVGEISFLRFVLYVIAQLVGALMGAVVLYGLMPHPIADTHVFDMIAVDLGLDVTLAEGIFIETVATFALIFVVLMVDINPNKSHIKPVAPLVIGAILGSLVMFSDTFTGASLNPARAFAAAIVTNYWHNHWIYWIAPLMASLLATLFFKIFETHWKDVERVEGVKPIDREPRVAPSVVISAE